MNDRLNKWISETYNISNPENCSEEESKKVTEIICKEKYIESIVGLEHFGNIQKINLSDNKISNLDLSRFLKLRELDCSYCPIEELNIRNNSMLEYVRFEGLRGNKLGNIDFSGNPKLRKIIGGQDGIKQIDFSYNPDIEDIDIRLSQDLRYIKVDKCSKLKRIRLWGVLIPYVDLTHNFELEHVEINYLNTYKGQDDMHGPGYPRPFIFVNEKFNKDLINKQDREYEYYTHVLVSTTKDSREEKVLRKLNSLTKSILAVDDVASFHYQIMQLLNGEIDSLDIDLQINQDNPAEPIQESNSEPSEFDYSDVTKELQVNLVKMCIQQMVEALSLGQGEKLQKVLEQNVLVLRAIADNIVKEKLQQSGISLNQQIDYARKETNQAKLESKQNRIYQKEFHREAIIWDTITNYLKELEK